VSEILPSDYKSIEIDDVCQQQEHLNKERQLAN
jgi:hypothetical protein